MISLQTRTQVQHGHLEKGNGDGAQGLHRFAKTEHKGDTLEEFLPKSVTTSQLEL